MGRKQGTFDAGVGERAAHARKLLLLQAKDVAKHLGVTRQTLSNYEHGTTPMTSSTLRTLCELYGISPAWMLGFSDSLDLKVEVAGRAMEIHELSEPIEPPEKGE